MMPQGPAQQPPANIDHYQDAMINVVYNVCTIFTIPVEMVLRPQYGSRYFPPVLMFFTAVLMTLMPIFFAVADGIGHMVPFVRFAAPVGLFGIGTFSKLFFLGSLIHGLRIWRRMIHMELEENSCYEGPPLPIFRLIPCSFWMTRIIVEPLAVLALSIVLPNFFILQSSAANYLALTAFMLFMKQYVAWYQRWQFLRNLMDMRNAGPLIAKIVDNTASDDDYSSMHLASTKNLPDGIRSDFTAHIARVFSQV
jgi:hypothetical protein